MYHQVAKSKFLKIFVSHPKYVAPLRSIIERGVNFAGSDCLSSTTYESNLPYALRFMIDNEIGGMTWIRVEKKNWLMRTDMQKASNC